MAAVRFVTTINLFQDILKTSVENCINEGRREVSLVLSETMSFNDVTISSCYFVIIAICSYILQSVNSMVSVLD